jgi:hypothetical protein
MAGPRLKAEVSRPKELFGRFMSSRSSASELNGLFLLLSLTGGLGFVGVILRHLTTGPVGTKD